MSDYESTRRQYRPKHIKVLLIAESPPPDDSAAGSRHFYQTNVVRTDDRLYINTVRALYPETLKLSQDNLEQNKELWLKRFQQDGWYMIEALDTSLPHKVTKPERQALIAKTLAHLIQKVKKLAEPSTKLILIKSNVFEVAAEPLRKAGFNVLNTDLVDYPGQYNQRAYREKLAALAAKVE